MIGVSFGFIDQSQSKTIQALPSHRLGRAAWPRHACFLITAGGKPPFLTGEILCHCKLPMTTISSEGHTLHNRRCSLLLRIVKGRLHYLCAHSMSHCFNGNFDL